MTAPFVIKFSPVGQDAERSLMKVHDGVVVSLVSIHRGVRVQAHNEVIALRRHPLEKVEVTDVK